MSISGDSWYVKLSDGDVHRVTLDQLDEAFQAGHIDGNTMVLASGATQWTKLGALAGIDDAGEEIEVGGSSPAMAAPQVATSRGATAQPVSMAPRDHTSQSPAAAPQGHSGWPASPSSQGYYGTSAAPARPTGPTTATQSANGLQSTYGTAYPQIRPIAIHSQGGAAALGSHSGPPVYMPRTPLPNSLRPISLDFEDLDSDARKLRRGSGKRWFAAFLAVSVLAGAGAVSVRHPSWAQPLLSRIGLRGLAGPAVATAPPAPPVAQAAPPAPPPAIPTPEPAPPPPAAAPAATAGSDSPLSPHFTDRTDRLTDDQKQRLGDSEKQKTKGHKTRTAAGASHHAPGKTKSTGFTTGGSKYDPLNSSI